VKTFLEFLIGLTASYVVPILLVLGYLVLIVVGPFLILNRFGVELQVSIPVSVLSFVALLFAPVWVSDNWNSCVRNGRDVIQCFYEWKKGDRNG